MGFMPLINDTETTTISDLIFLIFKVYMIMVCQMNVQVVTFYPSFENSPLFYLPSALKW